MKKILQAFKKLFKRRPRISDPVYICDPLKHSTCNKEVCWDFGKGPCRCTTNKKYAKLDNDGKPILATDNEAFNLEWMEEQITAEQIKNELLKR